MRWLITWAGFSIIKRVVLSFRFDLNIGSQKNQLAESKKLDVADLPEYAGRVFDYYEDHPASYRLLTWGQLKSTDSGASDASRSLIS